MSDLNQKDGLIIVYTGEGKGKTTAALGLAVRAAGWGHRVAIIQFIKGYKKTGEWQIIQSINQIDIYQTVDDQKISIGEPTERHRKATKDAMKITKEILKDNKHQVVILDEINNALLYDLVEVGEIIKLVKSKPREVSVVMTGRGAPNEIIEIADLVSEMKEIKHPYKKGVSAKKGIDY
jgi:cob(I)alamin adenosyltransferase